ncbi:MAG: HAMP domain-containing histidine kinase [Sedimentisphaerales bacterium]|nr:HAMP domain-containing histidine kinase [Sedimentisphaerales bacterium]
MYKWLSILSLIIFAALCGMGWLGYHSIRIWEQGLEGTRITEFAEVAEQIRLDINQKLDAFMEQEQNRPYTDYQYFYFPDNMTAGQQQIQRELSPLAGKLEHGLAYYNFQIQPDNSIITPNAFAEQQQVQSPVETGKKLYAELSLNRKNVEDNLLPILNKVNSDPYKLETESNEESSGQVRNAIPIESKEIAQKSTRSQYAKGGKSQDERTQNFQIESFKNIDGNAQIVKQSRDLIASNEIQNQAIMNRQNLSEPDLSRNSQQQVTTQQSADRQEEASRQEIQSGFSQDRMAQSNNQQRQLSEQQIPQAAQSLLTQSQQQPSRGTNQADLVDVVIEPFVPVLVPGQNGEQSIFRGQVFMLRRVQIENKSFLQGFQLNENKLMEEVEESTEKFIRDDMDYKLTLTQSETSAYKAILDFAGLGHVILNLTETDPGRLGKQINHLEKWYFSIISFVFLAVALAMGSLWLNARAQLKLAQKKDDFISAVSHELRTPLTSIRMHTEMLEKNWIKSEDKLKEYYKSMRTESERLSRLIENVLDFSRIQKKRKKFFFKAGNINKYVEDVVEMMAPYAAQKGFSIKTELCQSPETAFDGDSVTQIVVNLLDNAIKYARDAADKTITVRTKNDNRYILIEVEDHGPGIPHSQREKIFQEFYRIGAEATRETAGSGLGLALVRKFAQAHNGFVEIINTKPNGVIFRVALAIQ